ncbi:MAG: ribonuclease II [Chloroflexi bacterium HGW-Chloroflexi-10]|nr:MAG: ribonuclease II [Chloroflexi bacterium HGW-Chloroflexi-10]
MQAIQTHQLNILRDIAFQTVIQRGLFAEFSPEVLREINGFSENSINTNSNTLQNLRGLIWSSIDNDDSRDLDQLTVARRLAEDQIQILVAVADVDALVKDSSATDLHARHNTSTIYTPIRIFPMLPERLSTDLTSLNKQEDRPALVIEMTISPEGALITANIYQAIVRSHAKLAYNAVAAWLDGTRPMPEVIAAVPGLAENLKLQFQAAQRMKRFRQQHGALSLETIQAVPVFDGVTMVNLDFEQPNCARDMIEDFMIVANGITARFLSSQYYPSIRRVVRTPKRWGRIVEIAAEYGTTLPDTPDSQALEKFLQKRKSADPIRFPDLSLAIVKLLGAGEYSAESPGGKNEMDGHFGLAVNDYAHSTAPNRRYSDLITHRLVKAALSGKESPYTLSELQDLAKHFTRMENEVNKVERQVEKSVAATLLQGQVGEIFDGLVTGAATKGTWVRLLSLPVEGRLVEGFEGVDVGQRIQVKLASVDIQKGFIDFVRVI